MCFPVKLFPLANCTTGTRDLAFTADAVLDPNLYIYLNLKPAYGNTGDCPYVIAVVPEGPSANQTQTNPRSGESGCCAGV